MPTEVKYIMKWLKKETSNILRQYESANFRYPTAQEMRELRIVNHIWKSGDKFYKLAHEYYEILNCGGLLLGSTKCQQNHTLN